MPTPSPPSRPRPSPVDTETSPPHLAPSFKSSLWELRWHVEVCIDVGWSDNLVFRVPVKILPQPVSARIDPDVQTSVPVSLLSTQMQEVWQAVAKRHGLSLKEDALHGQAGDCRVQIRREHRGRKGLFLVGEIRYPSLHLGLRLRPARGLRRYLGGGLSLGDPDLDSRCYVLARDQEQLSALGHEVQEPLRAFKTIVMDDERAWVERPGVGQNRRPLDLFVASVLSLTRGLTTARLSVPPPPALAPALSAWQR